MSRATHVVLEAFLSDPSQELSGIQVCTGAGVAVGSVHPILARLEGMGWLESRWEDPDPDDDPRLPRRYYRLTGVGSTLAAAAAARRRRPVKVMRWRPVTGQS